MVNELHKPTTSIFRVEVLMICNWWNKKVDIYIIKVSVCCCVLLIFTLSICNMGHAFKNKTKMKQCETFLKLPNSQWNQIASEINSLENLSNLGLTKVLDFITFFYWAIERFVRKNGIEMYSTENKRKSSFAKRFIRNLKNPYCKYITCFGKMCILII